MGFCPQTNLSNFLERKGTPVHTPARLPACLRARCEHSLVGGGQWAAAATVVPESPVPALKVSPGTLLSYHPGSNFRSTLLSHRETTRG